MQQAWKVLQKQWSKALITKREKIFMNTCCLTRIFFQKTYFLKDYTYNNISKDEGIVLITVDNDSAIVITKKKDYVKKMQEMIDKGTQDRIYAETEDNNIQDLNRFQDFLYRNFSEY